ncbi:hypothetical protein B0H11DRAFT_54568 [Mycena galericulata]|nr:hypothetical protein B0H11DRAFT_54568 [Mycena galericulata]
MLSIASTLVALAVLARPAAAAISNNGLQIFAPGGDNLWWVVGQVNNVVWSCAEASPAAQQFTIWINNNDTTLLTAITPLIAVEQNFNCDQGIPANLMNQPVGDGYVIVLTDITNATNIYAQSDPFSIKALSVL